ncbi:hypothetical protein D3C71_1859100 [compost metagenome]
MGAPHRTELVVPGQRTVGVVGHIGDGKIVDHEGVGQAQEGEDQEGELAPGRGLRQAHPLPIAAPGADQRQAGLHQGQAQRQDHRQVTEFGNHCAPPWVAASCFCFIALCSKACMTSGGM